MSQLLFIALLENRAFLKLISEERRLVVVDEMEFVSKEDDEASLSFYDWLRNEARQVVGIRFTDVGDGELEPIIQQALRSLPYVSSENPSNISIFFSDKRGFVDEYSDDQDYLNNRIFRSANGHYGLTANSQLALESIIANYVSVK